MTARVGPRAVRDVTLVSLALLAVTSVPYIFGYLTAPADKWFSGIIYNVHDTAQYLSWMRESGSRLFIENKLTPEGNDPIFLNLHWWIPGRLAAILDLSLIQMYHLLRVLAIPFCVAVVYWFCGLFLSGRRRTFAFLLATLTSGLGWVWVVYKQFTGVLPYPTDVYTTPGNTFWVMLASPHLTLALALTLLTLGLAWQGWKREDFRLSLAAGGSALFLGLGHIYDLVTLWAALGTFGLLLTLRNGFRWRTFTSLFAVVVISLPAPLYFGWIASPANPLWQRALAQYDNLGVFTPAPWHLAILLGLTLFLGLAGFASGLSPLRRMRAAFLKRTSDGDLFLRGWLLSNLIAIYLPLQFRIMLLTGLQVVLAILAARFLFARVLPWLEGRQWGLRWRAWMTPARLSRWVPALVLLAVLPTNLYLLAWRMLDLSRYDYPFYLERSDVEAMRWLEANADPDDVVLSAFVTGHYIPGLTGARAFLSNAVMTMDFNAKQGMVAGFFDVSTSDETRRELVQAYSVDYVFHGAPERELGGYNPAESDLFRAVYESGSVTVYRAVHDLTVGAPE